MKELLEMMEIHELALSYQLAMRTLLKREIDSLQGDEFKKRRGRLQTSIKKLNIKINEMMDHIAILFRALKLARETKRRFA